MTKVLNSIVEFSFKELELKKLEGIHAISNPASGKVMQKNGLQFIKEIKNKYRDYKGNLIDVKFESVSSFV